VETGSGNRCCIDFAFPESASWTALTLHRRCLCLCCYVPKQQPKPTKFHVGPIDCIPRRAVARVAGISGSQLLKIANRTVILFHLVSLNPISLLPQRSAFRREINRRSSRIIFRDEIAVSSMMPLAHATRYIAEYYNYILQNVCVVDANVPVVHTFLRNLFINNFKLCKLCGINRRRAFR